MKVTGNNACCAQDGIVCVGDPCVDIMLRVSKAFLHSINAQIGGAMLVDSEEMDRIRSAAAAHPDTQGGEKRCAVRALTANSGSAANQKLNVELHFRKQNMFERVITRAPLKQAGWRQRSECGSVPGAAAGT